VLIYHGSPIGMGGADMAAGSSREAAARGWLTEIYPVLLEQKARSDFRRDSLVVSDFLTGFQVGYCLRREGKALPITKARFEVLKTSKEILHKAAISNLAKDSAGATFKFFDSPEGGVLLFDSEGDFHSSRLVLPNLYRWLQKFMGGPFVAGIPNRDVLIAVAESNQTALSGLPDDIDVSYTGRRFPLTKRMFRITVAGIALL
jgi:uncharacterized protein YtpQ (UPF0354 family)